jgi:hypothetical protein
MRSPLKVMAIAGIALGVDRDGMVRVIHPRQVAPDLIDLQALSLL